MADKNWMQDPSLKDIPLVKLDFLQKLVFEMNQLSDKEKLPFLLALAKKKKSLSLKKKRKLLLPF